MTFASAATAYLRAPGPDTLRSLRDAIAASPDFDPLRDPVAVASGPYEAGDYPEALKALEGLMPGAFLSPLVHGLLADVHGQLGDAEATRRESDLAQASLEAILSTGDGTATHPWNVMMVSDEYDVLASLGRSRVTQRSVSHESDPHTYDVLGCDDGLEYWFAVPLTR